MNEPRSGAHRTSVHDGSISIGERWCVAATATALKRTHVGPPSLEGDRCAQCAAASGSQMHIGSTAVRTDVWNRESGAIFDQAVPAIQRAGLLP